MMICSCGTLKLVGNYPSTENYYATTDASYDSVWDRVVDFFATSGVPITHIDKDSGLIISSKMSFLNSYTLERNGVPEDPNAFVVIPIVRGGFGNILEPRAVITGRWTMYGDFNVRITICDGGKTMINVNLLNLTCLYYGSSLLGNTTRVPIASTGVFEKSLLQLFCK